MTARNAWTRAVDLLRAKGCCAAISHQRKLSYWFAIDAYLFLRTTGDTDWRVRLRKCPPLLHVRAARNERLLVGTLWRSTLEADASAQRRREG